MVETELKFQVPPSSRAAVRRRFATKTARTLNLRARYFDTPDRRLARAGLALRLRQEGRQWVQTLKGPGASALHRLEHEVPVDAVGREPTVDIARHAGTPAAQALACALGEDAAPLQIVFETRVRRGLRTVRSDGALVELALDVGEVRAGTRRAPIWELELELQRGTVDGLLAQAGRWVDRHRLWLDVRSKAERGMQLAEGLDAGPAVAAEPASIQPGASADAALRAIVGACLAQVLPNAAPVAAGVGSPEHLHQLRVGLRRLRSALRSFGDLSAAVDPGWEAALAALFERLGSARDRDVIVASILPQLRLAGAPLADLSFEAGPGEPGETLRSEGCNRLLLELLGFAQAGDPERAKPAGEPAGSLASIVAPRLRHLRRRLKKDAAAFDAMDDARRHRARKRLKRLRYGLEFFAPLFTPASVRHWLARAQPAQELLGRFNDLAIAEARFEALVARDPRAAFAVQWLARRRAELVPQAQRALGRLAKAPLVPRGSAAPAIGHE